MSCFPAMFAAGDSSQFAEKLARIVQVRCVIAFSELIIYRLL
jgi:hypothetical protein